MSARAVKAWEALRTMPEGKAICREVVALMVLKLVELGYLASAIAALYSYDIFGREQDWYLLRGEDVVTDGSDVAVRLGSRARGEMVKTGANQGLLVGAPYICDLIAAMGRSVKASELVFVLTTSEYRRHWGRAALALGLDVGPPHSLRHSGAAEFVYRNGSLEACRRRGRWAALSSVQRYTKQHVLTSSRASLSRDQLAKGRAFWTNPRAALLDALGNARLARDPFGCLCWKALRVSSKAEPSSGNAHLEVETFKPVGAQSSASNHDFSSENIRGRPLRH